MYFCKLIQNNSMTIYMKKTIILIASLFAIVMAGCSRMTPDQVVDKFYKATQNKDFAKALTYTNVEEPERTQLVTLLENMDMIIYEYEILGTNIDEGDSTATVYLRLVTANNIVPDSNENELNVPCVKVGRDWKVTFF